MVLCVLTAAGCGNPLTYDSAYASNKNWLEVVSDKKDWQGSQTDSCYQFHFKFLPEDAAARVVNNNANCINRCCWRSSAPEVILDFNAGFKQDLAENGTARLFTPGQIKIKIKYSSILGLISAGVTPSGAIRRDGTVKLKYKDVTDGAVLARLAARKAERDQAAAAQTAAAQTQEQAQAARDAAQTRRLMFQADKNQSIDLVKRKYGRKIDDYLYGLDLARRKKGYVLINADKDWQAAPQNGSFAVTCVSKSKLGKTKNTLKDYPIDCGQWLVNLDTASVQPYNARAEKIAGN